MNEWLAERWSKLGAFCHDGEESDWNKVFTVISEEYQKGKGRYYHNLTHIENCLRRLDEVKKVDVVSTELEVSLWFHDIRYDPTRRDNELASCSVLYWQFYHLPISPQLDLNAAAKLILATSRVGSPFSSEERFIRDIDISELAKDYKEVSRDNEAIIKEYLSCFPSKEVYEGRRTFLKSLLVCGPIFCTQYFKDIYEAKARRNIAKLLEEMRL